MTIIITIAFVLAAFSLGFITGTLRFLQKVKKSLDKTSVMIKERWTERSPIIVEGRMQVIGELLDYSI